MMRHRTMTRSFGCGPVLVVSFFALPSPSIFGNPKKSKEQAKITLGVLTHPKASGQFDRFPVTGSDFRPEKIEAVLCFLLNRRVTL